MCSFGTHARARYVCTPPPAFEWARKSLPISGAVCCFVPDCRFLLGNFQRVEPARQRHPPPDPDAESEEIVILIRLRLNEHGRAILKSRRAHKKQQESASVVTKVAKEPE